LERCSVVDAWGKASTAGRSDVREGDGVEEKPAQVDATEFRCGKICRDGKVHEVGVIGALWLSDLRVRELK
jgi:hypothetical protein